MNLKTTFARRFPDYTCGNVFPGYMDYTYFYFSDSFLRAKKLRFGLVLNHQPMRFELWLLGQNIKVQSQYWELLKTTKWNEGRTGKPRYSELEMVLDDHPNFDDMDALMYEIPERASGYMKEIEAFLSSPENS